MPPTSANGPALFKTTAPSAAPPSTFGAASSPTMKVYISSNARDAACEASRSVQRRSSGALSACTFSGLTSEVPSGVGRSRRGPKSCTSPYKGVSLHARTQKYEANIWLNGAWLFPCCCWKLNYDCNCTQFLLFICKDLTNSRFYAVAQECDGMCRACCTLCNTADASLQAPRLQLTEMSKPDSSLRRLQESSTTSAPGPPPRTLP